MIHKCSSLLLAVSTIILVCLPVFGQPDKHTKINFFCENNEGILSTVAKNIDGNLQPVFHFRDKAFENDINLSELCIKTTKLLNRYFLQNNYPSLLRFIPTEFLGVPAICITKEFKDCDFPLLVFPIHVNNPHEKAYKALDMIVDARFRHSWIRDRRNTSSAMEVILFEQ